MKNNITLTILLGIALFSFGLASTASAQTISSQLSLGAKNTEVSKLQSFLATNNRIYPEGLITGYYGPLTKAAVTQFQINYNLPAVGNFGPMTLEKMNSVITSGLGLDIFAPIMSRVSVQTNKNSATLSWSTDSSARAKVNYDTKPLMMSDAQMRFTAPTVSGTTKDGDSMGTSQSITLENLSADTTYYYSVQVTDASGNVSVSWPTTFRTDN